MAPSKLNVLGKVKWCILFFTMSACIDQIYIDVPRMERQLVVDGVITDQPGPHTVKLSLAFPSDAPDFVRDPVKGAKITLFEDGVKLEDLSETGNGIYQTSASVKGRVGHEYHITIERTDGRKYTSARDILRTVGQLESVYFEFEARTVVTEKGNANGDRFNMFIDGKPSADPESYTRWRMTGTYEIKTFPELVIGQFGPAPLPCSGVTYDGSNFIRFAPCTCCICWTTEYEKIQHVANQDLINEQGFKHVGVGEVKITPRTFYDKYYVQVEQMSLSKTSYEFFRLLKAQAEGATSLFQPAYGEIKGNITGSPDEKPLGLFWASSVSSRNLFLFKGDVPYVVAPIDTIRENCDALVNSTLNRPPFW